MSFGTLTLDSQQLGSFAVAAPDLGSFTIRDAGGTIVARDVRLGGCQGSAVAKLLPGNAALRFDFPLQEAELPPVNTVLPAITPLTSSGAGTLLSCTTGTWLYTVNSYSYQWTRDGVNIGGATASAYTWTSDDTTHTVRCVVTAHGLTNVAATSSNGVTYELAPAITGVPTLSAPADWTYTGDQLSFPSADQLINEFDYRLPPYRGDTGTWVVRITFRYQGVDYSVKLGNTNYLVGTPLVEVSNGFTCDLIAEAVQTHFGFGTVVGAVWILAGQYPSERGSMEVKAYFTVDPEVFYSSTLSLAPLQGTLTAPTISATAASVTGYPVPTRAWQWLLCDAGGTLINPVVGATTASLVLDVAWAGSKTLRIRQTETNSVDTDSADSAASAVIAITP